MGVLLLVRHGQASFGTDDYDRLSEVGVQQARLVGERLRAVPVRRVVTGGMLRQRQTAEHLLAGAGQELPLEVHPGWDEYDAHGLVMRSLPTDPEAQAGALDDRQAFQALLDQALAQWTGGHADDTYEESWPTFDGRVRQAFDAAVGGSGATLVVTSAGPIAAVVARLWELSAPGWASLNRVMVNSSVTKVVVGRSGTSLVSVNDHAHLEARDLVTYR